jgi:putative ABC transport system permease protein
MVTLRPRTWMLLRDLAHLRGQVFAVTLVVLCGVASLVSMRATYYGLAAAREDYYSLCRFADVFVNVKRAPESLADRIRAIPGVAAVETRVVRDVTLDVPGLAEPAIGRLVGIPERRRAMLNDLHLRRGRYLQPGHPDEVIASEAFAAANGLRPGDALGAILNGRWRTLRIVGVAISPEFIYEIRGGGSIFPDNQRFGVLWMAREALGPAFQMEGAFNDAALSLAHGAREADVIQALDLLLAPYGGLGAYGRADQVSHRFLSDEIQQNRVSSLYVPSIFLAVAAFLIHIIMGRLIQLQRPQIALLKAFGFSNPAVGRHYLLMAMLAVSGGVALGAAAGMWLGEQFAAIYRDYYRFPSLVIRPGAGVLLSAAAVTGGAGLLGAWSSVRAAMALAPAEAMRPESPAAYRRGLLEIAGLAALLSAPARMILRNLERRPVKALLSVAGLALAVSILVVGRYFFDAMDFMVRLQFETAQRADVQLAFREPLTSQARYDAARLDGVLYAEPYREVPVRLRFGHRSRRTAILGLAAEPDLQRLVGQDLRPVPVPRDGFALTKALADALGARPGDVLRVEVLEGRRGVLAVTLTETVDELLGFSAYMEIGALNRLLREGPTTSGAYLAIDSRAASGLYGRLKRTPAASGIGIREALLRSFREILERSLALSMSFMAGFACAIAFGVIYNSARVALSERGKEFASLRILGFTKREIGVLLLGEQALLTLVAIPAGLTLGYWICSILTKLMQTELYRIPLRMTGQTYAFATLVVLAAAAGSGLLVARRIAHLDLIEVLKTRE